MSDDLRKLIEAVEAGTLTETECLSNGNRLPMCATAWDAFSGSLDAAIVLCEALLPGWSAVIRTNGSAQIIGPNFRRFHGECHDKPARALLLAVLRAKLMEDSHE